MANNHPEAFAPSPPMTITPYVEHQKREKSTRDHVHRDHSLEVLRLAVEHGANRTADEIVADAQVMVTWLNKQVASDWVA